MRRDRKPVLITDAAEDPERELRRREIRYVSMMLVRALCLIGAAVVVSAKPPGWPVWIAVLLAGMVLIPWLAVIIANDRPARSKAERAAANAANAARSQPKPLPVPAPRDDRVIDPD